MSAFMKSNIRKLERTIALFTVMVIAVSCLTAPVFAQSVSATLLTEENKQLKIQLNERIIKTNEKLNIIKNFQDITTNVIDLNLQITKEKEEKLEVENKLVVLSDECILLKKK